MSSNIIRTTNAKLRLANNTITTKIDEFSQVIEALETAETLIEYPHDLMLQHVLNTLGPAEYPLTQLTMVEFHCPTIDKPTLFKHPNLPYQVLLLKEIPRR